MNNKRLFFLFILFVPLWLSAQYDKPVRVEIETLKDHDDIRFEAVGRNGVFVFYETHANNPDYTSWIFINYDTNLQKNYHFSMQFPAGTAFAASAKSENYLYILLQKVFPKKDPVQSFLITIQLNTNRYKCDTIPALVNRKINQLYATDSCLVAAAITSKEDSLFFIQLYDNDLCCLGNIFPYKLQFCVPDTFNQRWLIGLKEYQSNVSGEIFLCQYDFQTQKVEIKSLHAETPHKGDYLFNSANAFVINKDTTLLVGTFNTLQDRHSSNLHSGVYTMLLQQFTTAEPRFYDYTGLKTHTKNEKMELTSSRLNLQLLYGNMSCSEQQFAFITEVFYPEYDYRNTYSTYDPLYNSYSGMPTQTFAGYRFVNAYITTFDRSGKLLWDNYLPLHNIITQQLYRRVCLHFVGEDALLFYPRGNNLYYTLLHGYDVLEKMDNISFETNSPREMVEYNIDTRVENWYDDYYLVSGYQYLINRSKGSKGKRFVFFLNKLSYH